MNPKEFKRVAGESSSVLKPRSIVSAFAALGYSLGVAGARSRANGCARILMLHGTPRRHAQLFESVMRYVQRQFRIVPLAALARTDDLVGKLAVTFDDGLRNNVEVAYPVLRALGVPATFFVCPGLVDRRAWLWNHEARQRLLRMDAKARHDLALELECGSEVESIIYRMKRLPLADRGHVEALVRAATPRFEPTDVERHELDVAGWSELRALDPAIVTIGSHTLTHPILPSLSPSELETEIAGSRRVLEEKLGRPVELFAYPNGDADAATVACVRRNYLAAVTVEEGWVTFSTERHLLPRINVPGSRLRLALALHRDYFAPAPMSRSGSQVASPGNAVMSAMQTSIMKKKGMEARAT